MKNNYPTITWAVTNFLALFVLVMPVSIALVWIFGITNWLLFHITVTAISWFVDLLHAHYTAKSKE